MADEIVQKLGLDATQAIATIKQLSTLFGSYAKNVQAAATANTAFSKSGASLLGSIGADAKAVAELVTVLGRLQKAQDAAALSAQKAAAAEAKAAAQRASQGRATKIQKSIGGELSAGLSGDALTKANQLIAKISEIGGKANLSANQIRSIGRNLSSAFVGPQGQIAKLLRQLEALRNIKPPGGSGFLAGLNASFIGAVTSANLLSGAISRLTNAIGAGIQASIEYEKTLARIQTISGAQATNIGTLNERVRALADEFGRPVAEVAAGQYELLSNQIGDVASSADVMRSALKLANVTGSETPEAVNAISSVLNSYNLATSDAADVSAKLFRAVDLGRFKLDEIANSLGRVTVPAAQLGVSFDEVAASLATLTVTGIPADEAMTLLSNTMRGLLKPTKDMQAVFNQLGVSSAEAGIQAFGFQGFLEKITAVSGDTASEITQLTENIRVARGVFGLTGQQAERAAANILEIKKASAELLDQKNELIINTNARQVETELNRLKNLFVVDIGQGALAAITALTQPFGGLTNVVKLAAAAATLYAASLAAASFNAGLLAAGNALLSPSLAAVAAGFRVATVSVGAFIVATGPIAIVATAVIGLGKALLDAGNRAQDAKKDISDAFAKVAEERRKEAELAGATAARIADSRRKELETAASKLQEFVAEAQALYNKNAQNAIASQKLVTANFQSQLSTQIKAYEQYVSKLESAGKDAADVQKDVNQKVSELTQEVNTNRFSRSQTGLSDQQQIDRALRRINELRIKSNQLESEGTDLSRERAANLREEAASLAEQTANSSSTLKDRVRLKQSEDAISTILRDQVAAEQGRAARANQTAAEAQKRLATERQNLAEIKSLEEQIRKLQDSALGDEKLTNEERVKKLREAVPLAQQLQEKLAKAGDPNLAKKLGISDVLADVRKPLLDQLGKQVSVKVAFEQAASGLEAALNSKEYLVKIKPVIDQLTLASGVNAEDAIAKGLGLDKIAEGILKQVKAAQEGISAAAGLDQLSAETKTARDTIIENLGSIEQEFRALSSGIDTNAGLITRSAQALREGLEQFDRLGPESAQTIGQTGLARATDAAKQFLQTQELVTRATAAAEVGDTETVNKIIQQFKDLAAQSKDNPNLSKSYIDLGIAIEGFITKSASLDAAKAKASTGLAAQSGIQTAANAVKLITDAIAKQTELEGKIGSTAAAATTASNSLSAPLTTEAEKANAAAAAHERLNRARAGGTGGGAPAATATGPGRAMGGMIYRAAGGPVGGSMFKPRGTDTIPAMLSPGEFVVNARSTRKFFSQLVSMNAGRQPAYRAEGGPITNVNFGGDINVNSGGNNGQVIGRDIWKAIDRAARRGTIGRLNRKTRTNR
jgi:TP901 family phage tail tape measure protein